MTQVGVIINEHTLTAEGVRAHVEALARRFDFIHPDALPSRLGMQSSRPFCLLTFDDGKLSNATQAAPVLRQMGVPALFCVTTGFIDGGKPLWFDRYHALIKIIRHVPLGLELEILKRLPIRMLEERLSRYCAAYGIPEESDSEDVNPMSWDQIRQLHKMGFVVGAHGVRHSILPRETPEIAGVEISESLARVTSEIGSPCRAFAFPNGNHTADLARQALGCGARLVFTTEPAWVTSKDALWRLPRIQLCNADSANKITLKIRLASFEGVLSNPDGTGRLYRWCRRQSRRDQTPPRS